MDEAAPAARDSADGDRTTRERRARLFGAIVEPSGEAVRAPSAASGSYDRPLLLRLCYESARSEDTRGRFLAAFFAHAGVRDDDSDEVVLRKLAAALNAFGDHLIDNLFLPLKAIAQCSSAVPGTADEQDAVQGAGQAAVYIFPPSPMTQVDEDGDLGESGALAASLLALLDPQALDVLRETMTSAETRDDSANVVTLARERIDAFARFQAAAEGEGRGDKSDSPPSSPLLALHAAIANILHASGAGAYIDAILADTAVEDLDSAGATNLGRLLQLRLDGWWDGGRSRRPRGAAEPMFWVEASQFTEEEGGEAEEEQ